MIFQISPRAEKMREQVLQFMDDYVYPNESVFDEQLKLNQWAPPAILEELKEKAKKQGLWNLFLPKNYEDHSIGLSNLEYAHLAEIMGRVMWASEVFNCSAPDTGNMEVLARYGTPEQQETWLKPLMQGEIRSAFCMTEPDHACSDATNVQTSIVRNGDDYVINGKKWWSSGAMNTQCKVYILMGKTDPNDEHKHSQQSMILVPAGTEGITIKRHLTVFGYNDAPEGHAEIHFENVRVPVNNILLGEGRGFEIAQGRLGPGRTHHCMRMIGVAQRALEDMCVRAENRVTFGKKLSQHQSVREDIAKSACEIEQARLLTLQTAHKIDEGGTKAAQELISMIKIIAPTMCLRVLDRAIQIHGGAGVCQDFTLARHYAGVRTLRLADGPDQVHMMQLGRNVSSRLSYERQQKS